MRGWCSSDFRCLSIAFPNLFYVYRMMAQRWQPKREEKKRIRKRTLPVDLVIASFNPTAKEKKLSVTYNMTKTSSPIADV